MKITNSKLSGALAVAGLTLSGLAACAQDEGSSTSQAVIAETTETPETTVPETPQPTTAPAATEAPTTAPPTTVAPTTTAPPPPPTTPTVTVAPANETVSQANARQKAADYLAFSAFSRSGLIEQLLYEGFTEADATYGVDALTTDWNEQAALKAAEYLDFSSFSRSGLVEQLVFEGFSQAEAEYGVSTTGL